MANEKNKQRTVKLVQMALLTALIFLMGFTPIGYLHVGVVEITFLTIPVVIGAIVLGPTAGAILGGMFGLTSFLQCFGMSPFGAALLAINPWATLFICGIPRILMGWLSGVIFRAIAKIDRTRYVSFAAASLSGAVLNTVFFMASLILLFGRTAYIQDMMTAMGTPNIFSFLIAFVGLNGLIEAIVCFVVGFAVSKALVRFIPANRLPESGEVK